MNAPFALDRPDIVHRAVCEVLTGIFPTVNEAALLSSDRISQATAWVRQVGMYLMAGRLGITATQTAQLFGRDRTTVSHAVQLAQEEAAYRPATAAFLDFLEAQVIAALERYAAEEANSSLLVPLGSHYRFKASGDSA